MRLHVIALLASLWLTGCDVGKGTGNALVHAAGGLPPPPTPSGQFAAVAWIGGLALLIGVIGLILSAVPALSEFIPTKAAVRALATGIALLVLDYLLVKFINPIIWVSLGIAVLAVLAHGPLYWKAVRAWWGKEVTEAIGGTP